MKKIFSSFLLLCCAAFLFAANTETSIFEEVSSAYNSGFYPGVVEKSSVFEKQFPDSLYLNNVKLMKGHALISMYRYEQAIKELSALQVKLNEKSMDMVKCSFLCGLACYYADDYKKALDQFYITCKVSKELNEKDYFNEAAIFTGRILFAQNEFSKAIGPLENVIANGNSYTKADYDEALQKLIISYNKSGSYKETLGLFNQLKKDDFTDSVYFTLTLYYADALYETEAYGESYSQYCKIVESGLKNLAVIAMKKAYLAATEHNIADPAEIFAKSAGTFADSPALVCDFWTRLGIDDFNKGEYETSLSYFEKAAEIENTFLVQLYKSKLLIQKDNKPGDAEILLENMRLNQEDSSDSYYSVLINVKSKLNKWNENPSLYEKLQQPDTESKYLMASSYYNQERYSDCISFIESLNLNTASKTEACIFEMLASSYAKKQEYVKACAVYENLDKSKNLTDGASMEYAKALFQCKKYGQAYSYANKSNDGQKDFLAGLCANNLRQWETAENHFVAYIKNQNGKKDFNLLAYYYKGYAEYRLSDWKNAYSSFVRYGTEKKSASETFVRKAYEYAAKSALQSGDYKNAAIQGENVVKTSASQKEKQDAILFCVEIYTGTENYDKAIETLLPYTNEKSEFAQNCIYQTAKIYEKLKQIEKADKAYTKLYTEFKGSPLVEEAMYDVGELYYSNENYSVAEQKFNKYIYQFTKGKFLDSALFFCADCNLKLGNLDKSILLNKTLVNDFSKSIYLYGSYKNLLTAYYATEDYLHALEVAKIIVEKYPSQATIDEIGSKVVELERIVGGTDKKVAEKISEYEKLGKAATKKGRFAGTELVKYYAADAALKEEAYKLAKEVFENQKDDDEAYCAAQNAEFIANCERQKQNNEIAAQMYLKAAQLYRKTTESKDKEVASVLYGAVEAFKAAELFSDAEDTANLLLRLYPDSNYAKSAQALIR